MKILQQRPEEPDDLLQLVLSEAGRLGALRGQSQNYSLVDVTRHACEIAAATTTLIGGSFEGC